MTFRIIAIHEMTGKITVACPGPFTHTEACTVLSKFNAHKNVRLSLEPIKKLPLPGNGKLNVRHRQMRGAWQCFAGNLYITCASGDSPQEAIQELFEQYDIKPGTSVKIHGLVESTTK